MDFTPYLSDFHKSIHYKQEMNIEPIFNNLKDLLFEVHTVYSFQKQLLTRHIILY